MHMSYAVARWDTLCASTVFYALSTQPLIWPQVMWEGIYIYIWYLPTLYHGSAPFTVRSDNTSRQVGDKLPHFDGFEKANFGIPAETASYVC